MEKFIKGQKVECVQAFSGLPNGISDVHHNPPRVGEVFTVIGTSLESDGELYLILGEVTNLAKRRGANDVWWSKKFKPLKEREVCENVDTKVGHYGQQ